MDIEGKLVVSMRRAGPPRLRVQVVVFRQDWSRKLTTRYRSFVKKIVSVSPQYRRRQIFFPRQ